MQRVIHKTGSALGVKEGEGRLVWLLLLANFLVGVGRNFSATAGNALFLERFGADQQPYLYIATSLLVPALAAVYLATERRLSFSRLVTLSFGVQVLLAVALRILLLTNADWVIFVSPLCFEVVFFLTSVCFWTLAGQLLDVRQAKRLFPLIGAGEWIAMVIGGFATPAIVGQVGTANLFVISAVGLGGALAVARMLLRDPSNSSGSSTPEQGSPADSTGKAPTESPLKNPYIVFMLLNNALSMVGLFFLENSLNAMAEERYTSADQLAGFLAKLWAWTAIAILLSRSFLSSRLLGRFGVNVGLLALPLSVLAGAIVFCALGSTLGLAASFTFGTLVVTRFLDGLFRYDLDATAGLILYQPLPPAQRSWTQVTNDGIVLPIAIGVSGFLLLFLKKVIGLDALGIMFLLPVVNLIWAASGFSVTRRYPSMVAAALAGHRFDASSLSLNDSTSLELLRGRLRSPNATEVLYALALLEESDPDFLRSELPNVLEHSEPEVRREILRVIARLSVRDAIPAVRQRMTTDESPHARGEAIRTIARLEEADAFDELLPFLKDDDPELRVAAIVGLMRHVGMEGVAAAMDQFAKLRDSAEPESRRLAARILGDIEIQNFYRPLLPLLRDTSIAVRNEALIAAGKLQNPRLWPEMITALDIPNLQSAALSSLVKAGPAVLPSLEKAFDEHESQPEFQVRVVRVFQQIRGEKVLAFLESHLDVTHPAVYPRVLQALSACRYRVPPQDASRICEKIRSESRFTAWLLGVQAALPETEAVKLLRSALEDIRLQCRQRVYLLLSFMYDAQAMFDSQNNLEHPSPERRAYAIELVDSIIAQDLKPFVLPLVDDLSLTERRQRLNAVIEPHLTLARIASEGGSSRKPATPSFEEHSLSLALLAGEANRSGHREPGFTDLLNSILMVGEQHTTDWLRTCALYAIAELRLSECANAVMYAIENTRDVLLRQTGVWALSKLDGASYRQQIARLSAVDQNLQTTIQSLESRDRGATPMLLDIEKLLILKTVPIFVEAPDHVLAQVVSILEEQEFAAGQRIFEKGDLGTSMYVIVSGKVRVHLDDRELTVLGERQVFGELALLDPEPRSASVTAIEPTLLFKISQSAIYELMTNHIEITRGIMRVLCRRIRAK